MITKMESIQELQNAAKQQLSKQFQKNDPEIYSLVKRMTSLNPNDRPTITVNYYYYQEVKNEMNSIKEKYYKSQR